MDAVLATAPSYSDYLKLPALLALQSPLAQPPVREELLFIIVHQTHELWFKQILCELSVLVDDIDGGRIGAAGRTLGRSGKIARLLAEQMQLLEALPAVGLPRSYPLLGAAAALQSEQFRKLEKLAGLAPRGSRLRPASSAAHTPSTSVREAFCRAMVAQEPSLARLPRTGVDPQAFGEALRSLLAQPALAAQLGLAEALLAFDDQIAHWRFQHLELARAMPVSTGGGAGGCRSPRWLSALERSFFPELWHWRAAGAGATASSSA
jgi:tryptophan 2,3-dioxygenase